MTENTNDKTPSGTGKKIPGSMENAEHSKLSEEEMSHFGEKLPAAFLSDAREGLNHVKDTDQLEMVLQQLNQQMHQQLKQKKTGKKKRAAGLMSWIYWAIFITLLLTIVGFLVIRFLLVR
jgi:hypothetical protein